MWKMAEAYVPYLSVKFREIVKIYTAELTGEKDLPPRWEICVSLLQKFMGFGITATLEPHIDKKADVVTVVKDVFENIKESIISNVKKTQDLGPELSDHVLNKVIVYTFKIIQIG